VIVIVVPATAAPLATRTVPTIFPGWGWAESGAAMRAAQTSRFAVLKHVRTSSRARTALRDAGTRIDFIGAREGAALGAPMEPIRVLLVDDEQAFVESLAKVLRRRGMAVHTAHDGQSALALAAREEFDVIVLDLTMPGMDGVATLRALRLRDRLTPVLLLSAHAEVERAAQALSLGAANFLLKPCPVDELVAALEDARERKAYARDLPPSVEP
jgi:two-component system OmpR family response regulator